MKNLIYLDAHATTPVAPEVLAAMLPYFTEHYGNGNHKAGWKTTEALENARIQVSQLLEARPSEITFTSGATEAINLALLGLANANSGRNHIVTQRTEHMAVLNCVEQLKSKGFEVTLLDVDEVGRIRLEDLEAAVTENTLVVAIMLANNEIGTVQPIEAIGEICHKKGAKFFCDITQAVGWYPLKLRQSKIDLAALSAHKFYGPRGVGALYVRKTQPRVNLQPLQFGGGQENALRPGTHNIPGIVGMGEACVQMQSQGEAIFARVQNLRDQLQNRLFETIPEIQLNGCPLARHPGNLNVSLPGISGEELKERMPDVIFSTSSACSSASAKPSHVISAIQPDETLQKGAIRFGIGQYTTVEETNCFFKILEKALL
ncbi:MAG: cysteine desulfurase family protein [Bacteroidota bacterium]